MPDQKIEFKSNLMRIGYLGTDHPILNVIAVRLDESRITLNLGTDPIF